MSEAKNMEVVRMVFEAWNAHDGDRLTALLDEQFVSESDTLAGPIRGRESQRQVMQMYVSAFPDLRLDIEQLLASGDYVVSRWRATGTHRGDFMGLPATNRRTEVHGCTVSQLKNGKAAHEWVYWDSGNLLRQLGAGVAPAQAGAAG